MIEQYTSVNGVARCHYCKDWGYIGITMKSRRIDGNNIERQYAHIACVDSLFHTTYPVQQSSGWY